MKISKPWLIIILIGCLNPLLFFIKSPALLQTKRIPISPLPLVFDSPGNFHYWAYTYEIEYSTNRETKKMLLNHEFTNSYYRSFLVEALFFILIPGSLISDSHESVIYLKEILCNSSLKVYNQIPKEDKVLKIKVNVYDTNNKIVRQRDYLCL